ncbi:MAG: hypothetical protein GVY13_12545 [Alphaproteobacteria bacterium]|nr:hypothetical protein [Alphaproteobacteria bacterium]
MAFDRFCLRSAQALQYNCLSMQSSLYPCDRKRIDAAKLMLFLDVAKYDAKKKEAGA